MSHSVNMNSQNKVVTITLNPALDLTGHLPSLNVGSVSLAQRGSLHPAGKGVNVAKVLADLGAQVTVTGFLGQDNQQAFQHLFSDINAQDKFIRVSGATRINVKLVEDNGQVSDINFPGMAVDQAAIEQFETCLDKLALDHDYFVLAGSLPPGISAQLCASWIEKLQHMGKRVLFDSSRTALKAGLTAQPWLIKPNDEELAELVGRELTTLQDCQQAAQQLENQGIANIVVSMGAQGVMWLNSEAKQTHQPWLTSQPPKMQVVSTVGAGDTLVAGLCWGHMQAWPRNEILSFATALSALAVSQVGVGVSDIDQVTQLQQQVVVSA